MCELLADSFDFSLIARDRPFGAPEAIVETGRWHDHGFARIRYLPVGKQGALRLAALLRETPHELLYTNGFFDKEFTIPAMTARRFGRLPHRPTIVAPRGEFSSGALGLKGARKTAYLAAVRLLGLMRGVVFHVTSPAERADAEQLFPGNRIAEIGNARALVPEPAHDERGADQPLRLAFCGRITPVKGLKLALDSLALVDTPVRYTIYGPISEPAYWKECQLAIDSLPRHVTVDHAGELTNDAVIPTLAGYDMLFLPSHSENFGHAIFESFSAGTPVLIGDRTPWRGLEATKAGYDVTDPDPMSLSRRINEFARLSSEDARAWRLGARAVAERFVREGDAVDAMRALFLDLIRPAALEKQ